MNEKSTFENQMQNVVESKKHTRYTVHGRGAKRVTLTGEAQVWRFG